MCQIWRIFFDNPLAMVLTKLESIHEKLRRLKLNGLMKITFMNWITMVQPFVHFMVVIITPTAWAILQLNRFIEIKDMVIIHI